MKTAIIKNGIVENVIMATASEAQTAFPDHVCIESDVAGIGWEYTDGEFITPVLTPEEIKTQEILSVNIERNQKIHQGMPYIFPDGISGVVDIKSDRDIINITGIGVAALALQVMGDTTTKLEYRDEANITHEMTSLETIQFGLAFVQWYSQKYKESWVKKDQL
jgi:hypothetical protein